MLTYTHTPFIPPRPKSDISAGFVIILCLFWLLPGLVGHDPWKPYELESTDIVWNLIQGKTWVLPTLVDSIYLDRNPLFFWIAALVAKSLPASWLPLHDSIRVTASLFTVLAIGGVGAAANLLYGRVLAYYAVLLLMGCLGFIFFGHHAAPHILSMAALSWLIYGLFWGQKRPLLGGMIVGGALLAVFLGGDLPECMLALLLVVSMCISVRWGRLSFLVFIVSALIIFLPLALLWPLALHHTDPGLYEMWSGYFLSKKIFTAAPLESLAYYIGLLPWFSWPTIPMSLWTLWHYRRELKERKWRIMIIFFLTMLGGLACMEPKDYLALPLLIPLCLLAVGGLDTQIRGFASALNWFGIMSFLLSVSVLWLFWFTLSFGFPIKLAQWLGKYEVMATVPIEPLFVGYALFITLCWIYLLTRSGQINRWAVIHWTSGVILAWTLLMSLLLPWLDWGKSYRYVAQDLQKTLQLYDKECIRGQGLGTNVKAAFHYFAGVTTVEKALPQCSLLLIQTRNEEILPKSATLLWTGSRYREHRERFYLYQLREQVSEFKNQ